MADSHIHDAVTGLVQAIKQSSEYQVYMQTIEELRQQPELCEQVNEFREKSFELQNTESAETIMERMDELGNEYKELRETSEVAAFLEAEASFLEMMREISMQVTGGLEIA